MEKCNPLYWLLNDDDKRAPDSYRPDDYGIVREIMWLFRNPFHNLTFYVLGVADKEFTVMGQYSSHVFNPDGGWKWHVVVYKKLRLPFVSYIGRIKFYIGWRERGNLGLKLTFNRRIKL
jgi:hypothetical protein